MSAETPAISESDWRTRLKMRNPRGSANISTAVSTNGSL